MGANAPPDVSIDPASDDPVDADVLSTLEPAIREWWVDEFGEYVPENGGYFTPPQREAIPLIREDQNVLIAAPTGSGKTLASFTAIIDELYRRERTAGLDNTVYCLYVSPLKSLANDIHRNLSVPLEEVHARMDHDDSEGHEDGGEGCEDGGEGCEDGGERCEDGGEGGADDGVDRIRHAIRHGDTDQGERQAMLEETPHILNTTPETLAILLNAPKFKEKLETVEYVIVDEIHSLADSKRGTHLSVSLERLQAMAGNVTRIGCSATVEPLDEIAEFLGGYEGVDASEPTETRRTGTDDRRPRDVDIVDTRFLRDYDLELTTPVADLVNTSQSVIQSAFYEHLEGLIADHDSTIVFTNTRSGAERVLHRLREDGPFDETNSGAHHGSLSKEKRQRVERKLKDGSLDVVTTSTSLELGIDMPHVDLVVQVGSPKSVAALLQRVGRAGHRVGETVTGRIIALDRDELIECAVMLAKAEEGFVDRVFVPERAQDVAAQHVYGMAINGPRPEAEMLAILRRAYPYREYTDEEWEQLLTYLRADYDGFEERNVYAKIWRDENDPPDGEHHYPEYDVGERLIGKRGRLARVIYMTNVGTIPDSFTCNVFTRDDDQWVGDLDEDYLDTLDPGDVFVLGGDRYAYRYRRGSNVYVDRTGDRPTVPSWFSERLPLSYDLGREILAFQRRLLEHLDGGGRAGLRAWLRDFPIDENGVRALARLFDAQVRFAGPGSVSTDERLVVEEVLDREEYRRRYYVHSTYGRQFNDGLSRVLAYRCAQEANANVSIAVADNGFSLSMPLNRKVDVVGLLRDTDPDDVRTYLRESLDGTDRLARYFRINATRSLMILKRYKGHEKSARRQQISSEMLLGFATDLEDLAVLDETYREIIEDTLDVAGIEEVLTAVHAGDLDVVHHRPPAPTPRAFGLATLSASDVVLAEDQDAALRDFHERVMAHIEE